MHLRCACFAGRAPLLARTLRVLLRELRLLLREELLLLAELAPEPADLLPLPVAVLYTQRGNLSPRHHSQHLKTPKNTTPPTCNAAKHHYPYLTLRKTPLTQPEAPETPPRRAGTVTRSAGGAEVSTSRPGPSRA